MNVDVTKTRAGENYLTEPEEKQLFSYLKQLKITQAERDYVLLKLTRLLGLRRVEVTRLNVGDVYGKTSLVVDDRIAAKGATGTLAIPVELHTLLVWFMRWKRDQGQSLAADAPLFVSRNGSRLSIRAVNNIMSKWLLAAGIEHHVTFHGLRHSKAQRIMHDDRYLTPTQQKNALLLANKQLRHKSLNSTMIYAAPNREDMATVAGL
jgi:integrase